jgi:hypothetical protein
MRTTLIGSSFAVASFGSSSLGALAELGLCGNGGKATAAAGDGRQSRRRREPLFTASSPGLAQPGNIWAFRSGKFVVYSQ